MKKKLLRLMDGRTGHISVTDGVISALEKNFDFDIIDMEVKLRNKFLLQIMKKLINYHRFDKFLKKNPKYLNIFYKKFSMPVEDIDLIISTGGETAYINIWLSRILNTANVYCSGLRGLNPEYFTLLVSGTNLDYKNLIYIEVFPNSNALKDMTGPIDNFCKTHQLSRGDKYFVLLLGGNTGKEYYYSTKDWKEIVDGFMYHVKKENAKALISTSRRTGLKTEKLLKELLLPYQNDIAYTVYFNQKPEKILGIFLQLGSKIFVTEESGTMIGESLYYRKPIFSIFPRKRGSDKKYKQYLENLRDQKRIKSIKASELKDMNITSNEFEFIKNNPMDDLAKQLKTHLKEIF